MWAAFPPLSLWFVAWVGMVPLILSCHNTRKTDAFVKGWVSGFLFHFAAGILTIKAHPGMILVGPFLALVWGGFCILLNLLYKRGLPIGISCGLAWMVAESVKGLGPLAFPWLPLGSSQVPSVFLIQGVAFWGTLGLSGLVASVNGAWVDLWMCRKEARGDSLHRLGALAVLLFAVLNAAWGLWCVVRRVPASESLTVAVVQPCIDGDIKWSGKEAAKILEIHLNLSQERLAEKPDLVIWPEGALGYDPKRPEALVPEAVRQWARERQIPILLGISYRDRIRGVSHNSATMVTRYGRLMGRYDKMKLLPLAETVPAGMERLASPNARRFGYVPGARQVVLRMPSCLGSGKRASHLGTYICFEALFPDVVRRLSCQGAEFLVHLSDEYWYQDRHASRMSLYLDVLRAVETHRSVVRAANAGPTCIIDPVGRIMVLLQDEQGKSCFIQGSLIGEVELQSDRTVFSRFGESWYWALWMVTGLLLCRGRSEIR